MDRRHFIGGTAAVLGAASLTTARADTYPSRTIRLIVPRSAGGVVDVIGREWANKVQSTLGSTYIENMAGGGGTIGAATAARAAADGYTLFIGSSSELVLNPLLARQSYSAADFTPIAIMSVSMGAVAVHPSVPATNLKELVAYAKANPDKLSYGSAGAGTTSNLTGELFKHLAGLPGIVHIPYKSANPGLTDLLAGTIPMMTPMVSGGLVEMHRAGKVRILAAASEQRVAAAPEIPTGIEQGYPDFIAQLFVGLFAPDGTPKPVVDKLVSVTRAAMADDDLKKKMVAAGFEPVKDAGPEQAARYLKEEAARWAPVLKASGMSGAG